MHKMTRVKDVLAVIIVSLLLIITITGILSLDFSYAYDFVNQYGQTVSIYGYGIYAFDSYFSAPIFIGTDICILFIVVPMFIYTYINYRREKDSASELKLLSVYAVIFYYAASISFGVTYNRLFLAYVAFVLIFLLWNDDAYEEAFFEPGN